MALWKQLFVVQELDSQIDQLRDELSLATLLADRRTAHLDADIARARREAAVIEAQLALREEQRAEAAAPVAGPVLAYYEGLRARLRTRPWVLDVRGTTCPACNLALPPALLGDAQRTGEPAPCPSCARLLVWRLGNPPR